MLHNFSCIKSNYHDYYFVYDLMKVKSSQTSVIFFMYHAYISCICIIKVFLRSSKTVMLCIKKGSTRLLCVNGLAYSACTR